MPNVVLAHASLLAKVAFGVLLHGNQMDWLLGCKLGQEELYS